MDVASPIHSISPQFDDHSSPLDDTKSLWAEILGTESNVSTVADSAASPSPSSATVIESSPANDPYDPKSPGDVTPYCHSVATAASLPLPATVGDSSSAPPPSLPAHDSSPMGEGFESCSGPDGIVAKGPAGFNPSSTEAVSDVKAPVIIDAFSCPASSTGTSVKLSSESSDDLADGLSSLHIQGSEGPSDNAKTNIPMTSSQMSDSASHGTFSGSHQKQSELEGPTDATGFQKSSPNHNTQSSRYGSQSHSVNVVPHHLHHRGDRPGQYRGRREQNRRNRDWNATSFNGRNMHMPPRGVPRFTGLPPPSFPFSQYFPPLAPPLYGGTYWRPGFDPHFPYYGPPPPLPPPGPVPYRLPIPSSHVNVLATPDSELCLKIVRQIEYYFSFENLIKDMYLRRQMDQQGWVSLRLIATFRKIKELTDSIQIILDALRTSTVCEILGDKIRLCVDWERWIIPHSYQLPDAPSSEIFSKLRQN